MSQEYTTYNLEQPEAREVLLVFQPPFCVHSVQLGRQGRVSSDESSQEVRCPASSHKPTRTKPPARLTRSVRRAGGFLQVVVSKAREHTVLVQAHCPSRFRYNPKTSRPQ